MGTGYNNGLRQYSGIMPLITNIQRYAIHDGGGIRTTVFFKGCPLACAWCHNPETQSFDDIAGVLRYSPEELAWIVLRDELFFGESGGVTISGGEPLAQDSEYLVAFLKILKKRDIHVACDTCGDVPWGQFEVVLPYVDLFLYDLKLATNELHERYTGSSNSRILANLKKLSSMTKPSNIWLRVPIIGGVNVGSIDGSKSDTASGRDEIACRRHDKGYLQYEAAGNETVEMTKIIALAQRITPGCKVSLLPYHNMAAGKWERIEASAIASDTHPAPSTSTGTKTITQFNNRDNFFTPSSSQMQKILKAWKMAGFDAEIGG